MADLARDPEPIAYVRSRIKEPVSEYQIMAGAVLPAMLVTAMNSDMPGEVLAQISRNVYDWRQRHLLIPRGTRVIGRYENQVALGQNRVLIAWTRLLFPDGRSLALPGPPTKDLRGASGVRSQVNNHYGRLYGQAALLSIIGAAKPAAAVQRVCSGVGWSGGRGRFGPTALAGIDGDDSAQHGCPPDAGGPGGDAVYIFLERDLVLDGPYVDREGVHGGPVTSAVP